MTDLTRRRLLASAAATAAVAAVPSVAIAAVERAPEAWSITFPEWEPGRVYQMRELLTVAGRCHVVMMPHVSADEPSERYISRPLRIEDGRFVEEDA
jgi:hypothetical protein